jgi:putative Holliday junction resolvase
MATLPQTGVLLALDPGEKRVGVAVCDALQVVARPLTTLFAAKAGALLEALAPLIEEHEVRGLLVGHPLLEKGSRGTQAQRAETFAHQLRQRWPDTPVQLWDERWSSAEADERLREATRQAKSLGRDAAAAAVILQDYLDSPRESRP